MRKRNFGATVPVLVEDPLSSVLKNHGLDDRPDLYETSMHSWKCAERETYGPCDCFQQLLVSLREAIVENMVLPTEFSDRQFIEGVQWAYAQLFDSLHLTEHTVVPSPPLAV